jgi:hypothetical protein
MSRRRTTKSLIAAGVVLELAGLVAVGNFNVNPEATPP